MSFHPTLGCFIQRDPLGYVDGGSLYQYEVGQPTNALDSLGYTIKVGAVEGAWGEAYLAAVEGALRALCPCVEIGHLPWRPRETGGFNSGYNITARPKAGSGAAEYCSCASAHVGGCRVVHDLLQTPTEIDIKEWDRSDGRAVDPPRYVKKGITSIFWNRDFNGVDHPGSLPSDILAHELMHAWSFIWMDPKDIYEMTRGHRKGEEYAVRLENQVSQERCEGAGWRTVYGGGDVSGWWDPMFTNIDCGSAWGSLNSTGWGR